MFLLSLYLMSGDVVFCDVMSGGVIVWVCRGQLCRGQQDMLNAIVFLLLCFSVEARVEYNDIIQIHGIHAVATCKA